jgi:hypothetical protein
MKRLLLLAVTLSLGCGVRQSGGESLSVPIWVSSHNRSAVDVYLLCGDRDAEWLGVVSPKVGQQFEIPAPRTRCVQGLNFFLVRRDSNRGYWVGPLHPRSGSRVYLTIEKYAGLSSARLLDGSR